ncbi:MAG: EAL domain-containing protein [Oscillospiraceae bacterium]|nr:EAL domain-containing protein [Oscillospiraceae bacterium]
MKKEKSDSSRATIEKTLHELFENVRFSKLGFFVLIFLYIGSYALVVLTSHSEAAIMLGGQPIPYRSITGVFSAIGNLCIVLLVVLYKKPGFLVSMCFLLVSFPSAMTGIIKNGNYISIAGIFTNMLTLIAIHMIYSTNTKAEKAQARLRDQAVTDSLTGLPNRFASSELMGTLAAKGEKFAVAVLNLKNFKGVNNTMGHSAGNAVLKEVASRLKKAADSRQTNTHDFVAGQGGDEFLLIIRDFRNNDEILETLEQYENVLKDRITVDGCDFFFSASIGWAVYPEDADTVDALLACTSTAMAEVKRSDNGSHILRFTPEIANIEHTLEIERKIRAALENDTLFFELQPQFDMKHQLSGFEALARMRDEDGNCIVPGEFIPVAEELGLIDQIDYVVFKKAAGFFGKLIRETNTKSVLSVNVSVRHLMRNSFLDELREVLKSTGMPPEQLEVEITESIMIDSVDKALDCINEIKKLGIKIAIDDFGTGYSSLSYLNDFPADMLKVDKSFIDRMNTNDSSKQYVAAIISIGHVMNFTVISEGVEQPDQLDTLRNIGCDYIQGFIWGRPMAPDDAENLVKSAVKSA